MEHRKLKIAFLSFYGGEYYRGVETYVNELANRLVDFGYDVTVFQNGSLIYDSRYKTVSTGLHLDKTKKNWYFPYFNYYVLKVKRFTEKVLKLVDKDTDIIIATNGQWQSLLCKIWALRYGKKLVICGQSGPGLDDRLNLLVFPNVFVTLTDFQKRWAKAANCFVKVVKIPNGVDLKKFSKDVKPLDINLPRPIILCVAALDFWKRLPLAIKAVSRLKNGSLLLVGKGEEEDKLNRMGKKLLPGRFAISSFPHSEMPRVFTACDLFTYPTSPWESFGIVMAEAMASGLPIVATKDLIRKEIVGDAGILVDPTNTNAYTQALIKALNTNWGNKPREQAKKFDWDKIAKRYEELINGLI